MSKQPTLVCVTHDRGLPAGCGGSQGGPAGAMGGGDLTGAGQARRAVAWGPRARPRQTGVFHTTPRDFKAVCEHGRQGAQEPYQDGEGPPDRGR